MVAGCSVCIEAFPPPLPFAKASGFFLFLCKRKGRLRDRGAGATQQGGLIIFHTASVKSATKWSVNERE